MMRAVKPTTGEFNSRLMLTALFVAIWFLAREPLLGLPSGSTVLIEWLVFLIVALWIVMQPLSGVHRPAIMFLTATFGVVYLFGSTWRQEDLGEWSMYWRGFGLLIAMVSLVGAVGASWMCIWRPAALRKGALRRVATIVTNAFSALAILWMLPSVLQPMDAWLNIGDATEKVLDEIAGPLVGNIPGYNQASGYSTLLGIPLFPLSFVDGWQHEKFVLLVLWVNCLVVAVPLLVAVIIRRVNPSIPRAFALVIGLVTVTISGNLFGNTPQPFDFNTSLFRELSFLARGIFPLIVGLLVATLSWRSKPSTSQIVLLASVTTLAVLNNPEFGVGSALAAFAVLLIHARSRAMVTRSIVVYVSAMLICVLVLVIPGVFFGGDWLGRRLGMFVAVLSGEGSTLSAGSIRDIPAMGIVALTYSVAVAAIAVGARTLRTDVEQLVSPAAATALYFGLWLLLGAPYTLNAGGNGAFGSQFHMIPLAILAVSLYRILTIAETAPPQSPGVQPRHRATLVRQLALTPVSFLMALIVIAGVSAPNGLNEWRRVQQPISAQKWTDEWSIQKLDWIQPSEITGLANQVGGVSEVGWWFSHGNAVELLTGVENLLGTSAFEGAVKGKAIRDQACEPLIRSSIQYVITGMRYVPVLQDCEGISTRSVSDPNDDGMVLVTINR